MALGLVLDETSHSHFSNLVSELMLEDKAASSRDMLVALSLPNDRTSFIARDTLGVFFSNGVVKTKGVDVGSWDWSASTNGEKSFDV
jgi:hypothetical protein